MRLPMIEAAEGGEDRHRLSRRVADERNEREARRDDSDIGSPPYSGVVPLSTHLQGRHLIAGSCPYQRTNGSQP